MLLTAAGCSGDSQTAGSRLNTENAVDKVLNQKTGGEDAKTITETEITNRTNLSPEISSPLPHICIRLQH